MRTSCLEIQNLLGVGDGLDLGDARGGGQVDHLHFVVGTQIIEHGIEEKAVELRFRQRIGTLEFDGVLRGQHEEGRGQLVVIAAHGAGVLLHGLKQRGLRLGRGAVDFVGQHDVAEDRSLTNVQRRWPVVGSSSMMSVPVMSEGIRSGVNWMRLKARPSVCAMVRTISVFAVPGKPVIRQWPPTNSAIRIWSSTSSWPTITWRTCARMLSRTV